MAVCKYTPQDIGLYLLNKMTPEEAEFQFHLHDCEKCRIKVEEMRRLAEGFKEDDADLPGVHIRRGKEKIKPAYLIKVSATVAALFLIGYFITLSFTQKNPQPINDGLKPGTYHHADTLQRDSCRQLNNTL